MRVKPKIYFELYCSLREQEVWLALVRMLCRYEKEYVLRKGEDIDQTVVAVTTTTDILCICFSLIVAQCTASNLICRTCNGVVWEMQGW